MTGRRAALAAIAVMVAAAGLTAPAAADTFTVDQCNAAVGPPRPADVQADLWSTAGGRMISTCGGDAPGALSFYTPNYRLAVNATTTTTFMLPPSLPHAALRAVWLDWRSTPQSASTGPALFRISAGGAILLAVPGGQGTPPGSAQRFMVPTGARALDLWTWCSPVNGPGWCNWPGPLLQLRAVTAEVEESVEPFASASGALLALGTHAGVEPITVAAGDADSGVRSLALTLGGVPVATVAAPCHADRLPPCPQQLTRTLDVDTRRVPDGSPRLRLTVVDAAGNGQVDDLGVVQVVNHAVAPAPAAPAPRPAAPPAPAPAWTHVPNGHPASPRARVRAWFEWRGRRRLSVTVPRGVACGSAGA